MLEVQLTTRHGIDRRRIHHLSPLSTKTAPPESILKEMPHPRVVRPVEVNRDRITHGHGVSNIAVTKNRCRDTGSKSNLPSRIRVNAISRVDRQTRVSRLLVELRHVDQSESRILRRKSPQLRDIVIPRLSIRRTRCSRELVTDNQQYRRLIRE